MNTNLPRRQLLATSALVAAGATTPAVAVPASLPGASDFDFLVGRWHTRQRKRVQLLEPASPWEHFEAELSLQKLPGGIANFDTLVAEAWRPGWVGMSFRVFNPATQLWSIHWFTSSGDGIDAASGALDKPVLGRFDGDVGRFEADEVIKGRALRTRYQWTRLDPDAARWEQFFSFDGGASWDRNWVSECRRLSGVA